MSSHYDYEIFYMCIDHDIESQVVGPTFSVNDELFLPFPYLQVLRLVVISSLTIILSIERAAA